MHDGTIEMSIKSIVWLRFIIKIIQLTRQTKYWSLCECVLGVGLRKTKKETFRHCSESVYRRDCPSWNIQTTLLSQMGIKLPQSPSSNMIDVSKAAPEDMQSLLIPISVTNRTDLCRWYVWWSLLAHLRCQTTRRECRREQAAKKELSRRTILTSRCQSTYKQMQICHSCSVFLKWMHFKYW